ncbi:hypothetical protein PYCCODRAFT_1361643 [Trametes coccinea BRFM310]|uniref:BTB domain-containing protein n=1 Tax=Trametes coccinea (strain BRFM310) TaxID=1353009 RepID=A0A1Y2IYX3_TRAC3|nr:hypothetical protein PYCCODRAFT_1361643 [Trametes coccinea BRFM310]
MTPTPASPTRPTPNDLQSHLYASFLQRKTADVALRISGSWHAVYRLHRVILIQAGFFQSLFTSGFSESKGKHSGHRGDPEFIDIVFDDLNITRAVCIARLYGGGPQLWISPSMIPTSTCPLTPMFSSGGPDYTTHQTGSAFPASLDVSSSPQLPPGHHPASPRFLLSLLATATFLSIPSVASQALSAILRTVGPHTVVRYLNFAIGRGIGPPGDVGAEEEHDYESDPAAGLEQVAEIVREEDMSFDSSLDLTPREAAPARGTEKVKEEPKHSRICSGAVDADSDTDSEYHEEDGGKAAAERLEPCYYYGTVSDKVGEAAACWLARWGIDMLQLEEQAVAFTGKAEDVWSAAAHHIQWATDRPGSAPPEMRNPRTGASANSASTSRIDAVAPVIWRRGGLTARWVRGIISSDAFFVKGEKERYEVARNVVEMRRAARAQGVPGESAEVEEAEFERLFRDGIYYANMHLDDLMTTSRDISPSTGKPYVPLSVLQAAHWNHSALYHRVMHPEELDKRGGTAKELGLGISTADIPQYVVHPEEQDKRFYPVPGDSSLRLGDSTGLEGASMEQLFETGGAKRSANASEANFFGLEQSCRPASSFSTSPTSPSPDASVSGATQWTAHPPFRFAVEFWDVDALKEKSRLHSHTVWYAGSLYNVYVQVVRKKGVQLGIYLHRQSTVDPIPACSAPAIGALPPPPRDRGVLGRGPSSSVSSPRPQSVAGSSSIGFRTHSPAPMSPLGRTSTTVSVPNSPAASSSLSSSLPSSSGFARSSNLLPGSPQSASSGGPITLPALATAVPPPQPYRDPRAAVSAYFTIACASATGASLTRFTSAPDVFSVSQSWGWKSSSLRAEEYLEVDADGAAGPGAVVAPARREVSLRATVVLGVV